MEERNLIKAIFVDIARLFSYIIRVDTGDAQMKVILESRKPNASDWSLRNDRFSFADEVVSLKGGDQRRLERATENAENEMRRWHVAEPLTQFRIRAI